MSHPRPATTSKPIPTTAPLTTSRLRRRTPGIFVLVPCPRMGRSIRCQGQLEAAAATILAASPLVSEIREQPLEIDYCWRGNGSAVQIQLLDLDHKKSHRRRRKGAIKTSYIVPDFLVTLTDGRQRLLEIKPSVKLRQPLTQRKLAVARAWALKNGLTFQVVTERELFAGPLLENVRLLARYRQRPVSRELCEELIERVGKESVSLAELLTQCDVHGDTHQIHKVRGTVLHLLATGGLDCELHAAPLGTATRLYPGGARPWDPCDLVWGPNGDSTGAPTGFSANWQPTSSSPAT